MGTVIAMLPTIIKIVSMLPTVEKSVEAMVSAISGMYSSHPNVSEVASAVEEAMPQITKAITDNTSATATTTPAAPNA